MSSQELECRGLCLGELLIISWWLDWRCIRCDVSLGCFHERAKSPCQMAEENMGARCNESPFVKESNTTSE